MSWLGEQISEIVQSRTGGDVVLIVLVSIIVVGAFQYAVPVVGAFLGLEVRDRTDILQIDQDKVEVQLAAVSLQAEENRQNIDKMSRAVKSATTETRAMRITFIEGQIYDNEKLRCAAPPGSRERAAFQARTQEMKRQYKELTDLLYPHQACHELVPVTTRTPDAPSGSAP